MALVHGGAVVPKLGISDGRSNDSSYTDLEHASDSGDPNRSHHLLKHSLSDGQKEEALAHFPDLDVKEAAREISKMGQRELQTKFKLVYGTTTHSNNNDWLRRKLYEAIGAAPIKAVSKTKPRKQSAKYKKAVDISSLTDASFSESLDRRSRRVIRGTPKGMALAERMQRQRSMGSQSLPSSPLVGASVLDMHRFMDHETTSTSEEDSDAYAEVNGEVVGKSADRAGGQPVVTRVIHQNHFAAPAMAAPPTRPFTASSLARFDSYPGGSGSGLTEQRRQNCSLMGPRRTSSTGLLGLAASGGDILPINSEFWSGDAWADEALKASSSRCAPISFSGMEDEDVLLLPIDLSAFDHDAATLL